MSKGAARIPNILLHNKKMDVTSYSLSWQNANCQHKPKRMLRNVRASCFLPRVGKKQTYFHQAAVQYCFSTADKLSVHFSGKKQTKELARRCRCAIQHQRRKQKGEGFDRDKTGNVLCSLQLSAHTKRSDANLCKLFFRCFFYHLHNKLVKDIYLKKITIVDCQMTHLCFQLYSDQIFGIDASRWLMGWSRQRATGSSGAGCLI